MLTMNIEFVEFFIQIPKYVLPNITLLWLISSNFVILTSVRNPEQLMYKALYEKGFSKKHPVSLTKQALTHTNSYDYYEKGSWNTLSFTNSYDYYEAVALKNMTSWHSVTI